MSMLSSGRVTTGPRCRVFWGHLRYLLAHWLSVVSASVAGKGEPARGLLAPGRTAAARPPSAALAVMKERGLPLLVVPGDARAAMSHP